MQGELISANEFCIHHQVEFEFVHSLHEFGLLHITRVENDHFIDESDLRKLEQLIRLHHELNINLEGIDAIHNLLEKLQQLQNELKAVKQRLSLYEAL